MLSDYLAQFKADKHQPLYILITIKHRVKLLPTTLRIYIYIKTMLIKSKPKRITERKKLRERTPTYAVSSKRPNNQIFCAIIRAHTKAHMAIYGLH